MKIYDDHLYHGAALIQVAEHEQFTAINSLTQKKKVVPSSYKINDHIALYLKYAKEPHGPYGEYIFTYSKSHINAISKLSSGTDRTIIAMVCVNDREICAVTAREFTTMISERVTAYGGSEQQYTFLVTAKKGKSLRLYMNSPGSKGKMLKSRIVKRNAFPGIVFG